jgi:hypothetical protein
VVVVEAEIAAEVLVGKEEEEVVEAGVGLYELSSLDCIRKPPSICSGRLSNIFDNLPSVELTANSSFLEKKRGFS